MYPAFLFGQPNLFQAKDDEKEPPMCHWSEKIYHPNLSCQVMNLLVLRSSPWVVVLVLSWPGHLHIHHSIMLTMADVSGA
jgi:hypothetical protein